MKFGKQLLAFADPAHLPHYISYDVLKKAMNVVLAAQPKRGDGEDDIKEDMEAVDQVFGESTESLSRFGCQPPDSRFHTLLQHELEKVNRFAALQLSTLWETLMDSQRELAQLAGDESHAAVAERHLEVAARQLVELERFQRLNFTGFRKIVKKFDKKMRQAKAQSGSLASWFTPQLPRERFMAPLDPQLLALATGHAALRQHRRARAESMPSVPGTGPEGSTVFWLTPSARMQALCMLVKRFSVVLPEPAEQEGDALEDVASLAAQQHRLLLSMSPDRVSTQVTMTYFDDADFQEYSCRLKSGTGWHTRRLSAESGALAERDGAASALEWRSPGQALDAFPVHSSEGEGSPVSCRALQAAAKEVLAAEAEHLAPLARDVAAVAARPGLAPVATVGLSRVLLHGNSSSTLGARVAIDEDVQFTRGPARSAATAASDAIDFPYCLLEVAGCSVETATWFSELKGHAILRKVSGFSIGAQAVAALHTESVPELPHWYQSLSMAESSSPPEAWGLMLEWRAALQDSERGQDPAAEKGKAAAAAKQGLAAGKPPAAAPAEVSSMENMELRPKDFLASERTMLEWMHTVVALAFLGYGLWHRSLQNSAPDERERHHGLLVSSKDSANFALGVYGLVLLALAIAFCWHAVCTHSRRLRALVKKDPSEPLFNARRAPVLFAALLASAMTLHLALQALSLRQKWLAPATGAV